MRSQESRSRRGRRMTEGGKKRVLVPESVRQSLIGLQSDKKNIEYGGILDFEKVNDKNQFEKLIAYLGTKESIPENVLNKIQDYEVQFHTHPREHCPIATAADILQFIGSDQQVSIIVGSETIFIMEKTVNTPEWNQESIDNSSMKFKKSLSQMYEDMDRQGEEMCINLNLLTDLELKGKMVPLDKRLWLNIKPR